MPGARHGIGVDFGRRKDSTVFAVCTATVPFRLVDYVECTGGSWDSHISLINTRRQLYPGRVFVDGSGVGDALYERIPDAHSIVLTSGERIGDLSEKRTSYPARMLIGYLVSVINRRGIVVESATAELRDQLTRLVARTTAKSRKVRFEAAVGHDDGVFAVALAILAASMELNYAYQEERPAGR